MAILANDLLTGVKRRISMPSSQVLLEDTDILALADGVISGTIVPLFESVDGDYFVTSSDITLVASTSEYDVPYRSIGRGLRELKLKDGTDTANIRNIAKISIEDAHLTASSALISGFYFKNDRIHVVPDVPSSLTNTTYLEAWYRQPPNKLVATSSCATVSSATTTIVTVDAVPSTISSATPIDFIQAKSGSRIYSIDKTPTGSSANTLTFTSGDIPTVLTAGDYIALAGYSPVINSIPNEAYSLVESLTCKRCLKAISDYEGAAALSEDIAEETKALLKLIEPRIDGEPTVIINRNSLVRRGKYNQRRWLYGQ